MTNKTKIDTLWNQLRQAINEAYSLADQQGNDDGRCLRDYAENISWSDDLATLLGRESAEERRHRSNRPSVPGFSVDTASKLLIMGNVLTGADMKELPRSTAFLVLRRVAVESEVIGFLIRKQLTTDWRDSVKALDYAKLMQA